MFIRVDTPVFDTDYQPGFYALWRSFSQCMFVEDEGDVVFYKNKQGKAVRKVATSAG